MAKTVVDLDAVDDADQSWWGAAMHHGYGIDPLDAIISRHQSYARHDNQDGEQVHRRSLRGRSRKRTPALAGCA
jgi:hypothetical protein